MSENKIIIRTGRNTFYEYDSLDVEQALNWYIEEVLKYGIGFEMTKEKWNIQNSLIASKPLSVKVNLINGLCRLAGSKIKEIIVGTFIDSPQEIDLLYSYSEDCNEITITGRYSSGSKTLTIPSSIGGVPVTAIKESAFDGRGYNKIIIPGSVKIIGNSAFEDCDELEIVSLGKGIEKLGYKSFSGCTALTEITIPGSVDEISAYSFSYCEMLEKVVLEPGIKTIGSGAFASCLRLKELSIPSSVTVISGDVFTYSGIQKIRFPANLNILGDFAFTGCSDLESVILPNKVRAIERATFYGCTKLSEVYLGNQIEYIGSEAFCNCTSLSDVEIPDSVTSIGRCAFENCTSLLQITIPDSVTKIYSKAFYSDSMIYCNKNSHAANYAIENNYKYVYLDGTDAESIVNGSFKELTWNVDKRTGILKISGSGEISGDNTEFPWLSYDSYAFSLVLLEGLTAIAEGVFSGRNYLTSVTIPSSISSIGNNAFQNCNNLAKVYAPDLESWLRIVFSNNYSTPLRSHSAGAAQLYLGNQKISDLEIPTSISKLNNFAFCGCSNLKSIKIPGTVKSIGQSAFSRCTSLEQVELSEGLETITNLAFYGCTKLTSIAIPSSATNLEGNIFRFCSGLTSITLPFVGAIVNGTEDGRLGALFGTGSNFYIPEQVKEIEIIPPCEKISDYAFNNCTGLIRVTIPSSMRSIGKFAFAGCTNLRDVIIDYGVTSLDNSTFEDCSELTDIVLPNSITDIGEFNFYNCTNLVNVSLSNNLRSIPYSAFNACTKLRDIILPDSVTGIGQFAFTNCIELTNITLGNGLKYIGDYAFVNCIKLTSLTLPTSITDIHDYAFTNCLGLKTIYYKGTKEQWLAISGAVDATKNLTVVYNA